MLILNLPVGLELELGLAFELELVCRPHGIDGALFTGTSLTESPG